MSTEFSSQLAAFLQTWTPGTYSEQAAILLAGFFSSCPRGHGLLDRVYDHVYQGKVRKRDQLLVRKHTESWCSPDDAVGLILDLGIPRSRYKTLLSFMNERAKRLVSATGYQYGNPFPSFKKMEVAWTGMLEGNLAVLQTQDPVSGVWAVQWPFNQWLDYINRQPQLAKFDFDDPVNTLTFIVRGDGFPVAGGNWSHLNVTVRQWGRRSRQVSHNFVIAIAYKDDKDPKILARCWKDTIEVLFLIIVFSLCAMYSSNARVCFILSLSIARCHRWDVTRHVVCVIVTYETPHVT
jgi:hypothetical protein